MTTSSGSILMLLAFAVSPAGAYLCDVEDVRGTVLLERPGQPRSEVVAYLSLYAGDRLRIDDRSSKVTLLCGNRRVDVTLANSPFEVKGEAGPPRRLDNLLAWFRGFLLDWKEQKDAVEALFVRGNEPRLAAFREGSVIAAGRRSLCAAWRGGSGASTARILEPATGRALCTAAPVEGERAELACPEPLPLGRYELEVASSNGAAGRTHFQVIPAGEIPTPPRELAARGPEDLMGGTLEAAWLASREGGLYAFEAYQRACALARRHGPALQLRDALENEVRPEPPLLPEAVSLLGEPLVPAPLPPEVQADREAKLAKAREDLRKNPDDADALIWVGRRTAYLGRYREAIEIFSEGIAKHPDDPRFYRHRGHRFLTLREVDLAIRDFEKAARLIEGKPDEVEPDGLPNAKNIPTSTLQSNVWYHLGLAHYLEGDFEKALAAYRRCLDVSKNPDMLVATSHWLYMTLRRLGREAEAREVLEPIRADLDVIENHAYLRLLLMYKGEISPDDLRKGADGDLDPPTLGYGLGNWHLYNGRREEAVKVFREVLAGGSWAAFGYVAAEADLKRL